MLKPEKYEGFIIVFNKSAFGVNAGFPRNANITHGRNKEEAFEKMKGVIQNLNPIVRQTYRSHGDIMRKLEDS